MNDNDWIEDIPSAWKGHRAFAEWLVSMLKPSLIVELGVDYGYSSFVFAKALIDNKLESSRVIGVDLFQGDVYTSYRNTYDSVVKGIEEHDLPITLVKKDFSEYSKEFSEKCDILHIDGLHTYEAVKNDYKNWSKHVSENGVILLHDIYMRSFGVIDFFRELRYDGYKLYFIHSAGLGILTKNKELAKEILKFGACKNYNTTPF